MKKRLMIPNRILDKVNVAVERILEKHPVLLEYSELFGKEKSDLCQAAFLIICENYKEKRSNFDIYYYNLIQRAIISEIISGMGIKRRGILNNFLESLNSINDFVISTIMVNTTESLSKDIPLIKNNKIEIILDCFKRLNDGDKKIIEMYFFEGKNLEEIGVDFRFTKSRAEQVLFGAIYRLKKIISQENDDVVIENPTKKEYFHRRAHLKEELVN